MGIIFTAIQFCWHFAKLYLYRWHILNMPVDMLHKYYLDGLVSETLFYKLLPMAKVEQFIIHHQTQLLLFENSGEFTIPSKLEALIAEQPILQTAMAAANNPYQFLSRSKRRKYFLRFNQLTNIIDNDLEKSIARVNNGQNIIRRQN